MRNDTAPGLVASELALTGLSLVTAASFARVFVGWGWLATLVFAALGGHLLAIACRRLGWGLLLSTLVSGIGLVLFVTLGFYRDTTRWLLLPTGRTWDALGVDLRASFDTFATAIAPVPASTGFLLGAAASLWVGAFLADGFAYRAAVVVEALLPSTLLFVFASAVAGDRLRLATAAVWVGAAALAFCLLRSVRDESGGWLAGHRQGVASASLRVGGTIAGVAVLGAALIAPNLPGAGQKALVDTRRGGNGTRQTFSPLVNIRGRLSDRSDLEAFRVKASAPSYWRLTALDEFDGEIWKTEQKYGDATGRLGGGIDPKYGTEVTQQFTITGLSSEWLPAAFTPVRLEQPPEGARFDENTSTFWVRKGSVDQGTEYTVVSRVPTLTAEVLAGDQQGVPGSIQRADTRLPDDFPANLRTVASQITASGQTEYGKARLLQDWFTKNFTYTLDVKPGHGVNAIEQFLKARAGYCEQFAGTFAAFARAVGLPARVAVGFTWGVKKGDEYVVQGKHAHAWPEVYFGGIGWVPFEPTPSRGLPGAEGYTGVPQAQEGEQPVATTVPTATTVAGAGTTSLNQVRQPGDEILPPIGGLDGGGGGAATKDSGPPSWLIRLLALVVVGGIAVTAWLVLVPRLVKRRWARRRARAADAAERTLLSWHETAWLIGRSGVPIVASETPYEYADRAAKEAKLDPAHLRRLAEHATTAAYAPDLVPERVANEADAVRHEVERTLWNRTRRGRRWRWMGDPRPLVAPMPSVRVSDGERSTPVR